MPRKIAPALQAEIDAPVLRPFLAVHIDLPDPVHAVTGNADVLFGGATWTAIGGIGRIDTIDEGTDGSAAGVSATLNGVPSEFREDVADQAVRGCVYELHVGAIDFTYQQVIGTKLIWKGRLDSYEIVDAGETLTVTAGGESRARDQRRPAIKRYTDDYQRRRHEGDRFFEYVSQMAEIPILWAKATQDSVSTGGGGIVRGVQRAL